MAVITLLTDFGTKDYYVSMFKGDLLMACPSVQLVDISHDIPSYDINTAAFFLKNTYHRFPKNTIHIIRVCENGLDKEKLIAVKYNNYYFIAPDNGILTLALEDKPELVIEIDTKQVKLDNMSDFYCRAVKEIIFNNNIGSLGKSTNNYVEKKNILPIIEKDSITGRVIYVDKYGNIISNIRKEDLERYNINETKFRVQYRRSDFIETIVKNYADVPPGNALARFNSIGYFEIGIYQGNASQLLGMDIGSQVKIWIE